MKKLDRGDRVAIRAVLVGALVFSAITLGAGVIATVQYFAAGEVPVQLLASEEVQATAEGSARVTSGTFSFADVTLAGLSGGARALLASGAILGTLTSLSVSLAIAFLCWRVLREHPFSRSLTHAALFTGAALAIGSLLAQGVTGFGMMQSVDEIGVDPFTMGFMFDPAPVFAGFGILALGAALQYGERLQRDTEGLI